MYRNHVSVHKYHHLAFKRPALSQSANSRHRQLNEQNVLVFNGMVSAASKRFISFMTEHNILGLHYLLHEQLALTSQSEYLLRG